jgi:hypothetical protein
MGKESEGSFRAHSNYVRAFARLAGFAPMAAAPSVLEELADVVAKTDVVKGAQKLSGVDVDQVRKSLVNAWGTELLLGLAGEYASEKELVGMANNWGVVQTYYVSYHATQARCRAGRAATRLSSQDAANVYDTLGEFRVPRGAVGPGRYR